MLLWSVCFVVGYKCRVDDNSWTGANRKILENELAHKRLLLHNIQDFDVLCQKAGVKHYFLSPSSLFSNHVVFHHAITECNVSKACVLTLTCQWKSGDDLHQNDADFYASDPAMQIRQEWVPSIGGVYVSCSSPSRELVGTVSR
jgi:hypothetical protein